MLRVRWNGREGELRDQAFGAALVHFDGDQPADSTWVPANELEVVGREGVELGDEE